MKAFTIENTWLNGTTHGWGNGYVAIPKGHPLHGKDYDTIHTDYPWLEVHGGLTLAREASKFTDIPKDINPDDWVIGFDTAHYGDSLQNWPDKESVMIETQKLLAQIEKINL